MSIEPRYVPYPKPTGGAPNIVVIVLDDVGFGQLGCFGSPIRTPNIDRLAAEGLRYNRFHVTSICSSTRAALMTGRNHHAVGVGATQETSFALPGYNGRIPKSAAALPRLLRDNGYNTFAVGKWHLTPQAEYSSAGPFERWPLGLGFERYYGFLGAETNHWSPELVRDNTPIEIPEHDGYHLTEDLADQAINMIRNQRHAAPDKPFLCWFATGAAHAPHHVSREWFEPYAGAFDGGWEEMREGIYARQLEMGIIPRGTVNTPRPEWVQQWAGLSDGERRLFCRYMEVFAGFVTHTDAQIGRILDYLDKHELTDNTIVMVMSDNGTSSEGGVHGTLNESASWLGEHATIEEALAHIDDIGGPNHTNHYPWGWAWAGNAPFQLWKRYSWLGGVRAPLVVRWPNRITDKGAVRTQFMHAVDLTPTLMSACGLTMPDVVDGVTQQRIDGADASATFDSAHTPEHRTTQYFEMHGSRSIYSEGWKATTNFVSPLFNERAFITGSHKYDDDTWQLFNLDEDFSESTDLSGRHPDKVRALESLWVDVATQNNVFPLFDPSANYPVHPGEYPLPRSMMYEPSDVPVAAGRVPMMLGGFTMTARVTCASQMEGGVLAAFGDHQGGWAFRIVDGEVRFDAVHGKQRTSLRGGRIGVGEHDIEVTMVRGGALTLSVDGREVASGSFAAMFFFPGVTTSAGGMWVGRHDGLEVSDDYQSPAHFSGELISLHITSGGADRPSMAVAMKVAEGAD